MTGIPMDTRRSVSGHVHREGQIARVLRLLPRT